MTACCQLGFNLHVLDVPIRFFTFQQHARRGQQHHRFATGRPGSGAAVRAPPAAAAATATAVNIDPSTRANAVMASDGVWGTAAHA
jgi:hypothetical protein